MITGSNRNAVIRILQWTNLPSILTLRIQHFNLLFFCWWQKIVHKKTLFTWRITQQLKCPVEMRREHKTQTNPCGISLIRRSLQTSSGEMVNRRGGRECGNGSFSFQRFSSTCAWGERCAYVRRWWWVMVCPAPAHGGFYVRRWWCRWRAIHTCAPRIHVLSSELGVQPYRWLKELQQWNPHQTYDIAFSSS